VFRLIIASQRFRPQVPGGSDSDAKRSSHDALQDDITLLLEPQVAELVCVGVGIAGTWVQLIPIRDAVRVEADCQPVSSELYKVAGFFTTPTPLLRSRDMIQSPSMSVDPRLTTHKHAAKCRQQHQKLQRYRKRTCPNLAIALPWGRGTVHVWDVKEVLCCFSLSRNLWCII